MMAKCDYYYPRGMKFLCYGTKEMEECSCGGDTSKCNFYPEKRKPKVQTMANDLISRKALLAEYDRVHIGPPGGARKLMEDAPTVDAVEVVRCKDCKHWEDFHGKMFCVCGANQMAFTNPDDFCSYGERKDNENL